MLKRYMVALSIVLVMIIIIISSFINLKESNELQEVSVILKWLPQAQFAGIFVAKEKGFYQEVGLDVNIKNFDFKTFPADSVDSKESEFGIMGGDEIILDRSKGKKVKAIAALFQKSALGFVTTEGLTKPSDLKGKKLGLQVGVQSDLLLRLLLKKGGVLESEVEFVEVEFDHSPFSNGEIDLFPLYVTDEPFILDKEGKKYEVILPYDYGINFYGDVLITNDDLIKENPELVQKFLEATLRGYQYSLENNDDTVEILRKYEHESYKSPGHEEYILEKQHPFIFDGTSPIGGMKSSVWEDMYETLIEQKVIENPIDINDTYTTQFIDKVYGEK